MRRRRLFSLADTSGAILEAVRGQNGSKLARRIADPFERGTDAPFLTNHDMGRSAGMLMQDAGKMRAAAAAYLLAPGCPTVYYGEEIGMTGSGRDENKRLPMVWGEEAYICNPPEAADQKQKLTEGVVQQEEDPQSLLNTYRAIIAIHSACPEIDSEQPEAFDLGKTVYAVRYGTVSVLINMSKKVSEIEWPAEAALEQVGGAERTGGVITMQPWSVAVLKEN